MNLSIQSDPMAVRLALQKVMADLNAKGLRPEDAATVEIVLAEVLNNIVEHAYGDGSDGCIDLRICSTKNQLEFQFTDNGNPMPFDRLPDGKSHDLECASDDLPEGGFGWFLIRDLTHELRYTRSENRNFLGFKIPLSKVETTG